MFKQTFILFYVSSTSDVLTCVQQPGGSYRYSCGDTSDPSARPKVPKAIVARDSRHLSAATTEKGIMISYEDRSNVLNVMYGVTKEQRSDLEWQNVTNNITSAAAQRVPGTGVHLEELCTFSLLILYCMITNNPRTSSGIIDFQIGSNTSSASDIRFHSRFLREAVRWC